MVGQPAVECCWECQQRVSEGARNAWDAVTLPVPRFSSAGGSKSRDSVFSNSGQQALGFLCAALCGNTKNANDNVSLTLLQGSRAVPSLRSTPRTTNGHGRTRDLAPPAGRGLESLSQGGVLLNKLLSPLFCGRQAPSRRFGAFRYHKSRSRLSWVVGTLQRWQRSGAARVLLEVAGGGPGTAPPLCGTAPL